MLELQKAAGDKDDEHKYPDYWFFHFFNFFNYCFLVYSTPAKEIVQSEIRLAFTSLLATARSDKIDNDLSSLFRDYK